MLDYEKQLDFFIQNIQSGNFYEAHEDLELLWYPRRFEESDEVKLLKGFINASVSLELAKKGKKEQAKKVWQTYLKYETLLENIDSPHTPTYRLIAKLLHDKALL